MNVELIGKVSLGYIRLFPELLDRYYRENDQTIIKLISEKISEKKETKGFINISELEKEIEEFLKIKNNE